MKLGPLNRAAKLFTNVQTSGKGGAVKDNLVFLMDLFVTVDVPRTRMGNAGERDAELTETVFLSRWFPGLKDGMEIQVEGVTHRIVRRDEIGRRQGWRIFGKETS